MPEINHTVILVVGFEQQTSERFENQCDRINGLLDARIERVQTLTDAREKISDTQYDVVVICRPANAAIDFAREYRLRVPCVILSPLPTPATMLQLGRLGIGYIDEQRYYPEHIAVECWRAIGRTAVEARRHRILDESTKILTTG